MFEFDVRLSGDGTVMLMHDDTVERTTNGAGRVGGLTWGELARLDAGHYQREKFPVFVGEGIPTLESIARYCIANGLDANVEIKSCPGREAVTGGAVALEVLRLWKGAPRPPLISSFEEPALEQARDVAPDIPRALLVHDPKTDWKSRLERLDCVALDADYKYLSAALVGEVHGAGYAAVCYTPNDPEIIAKLDAWGLDCIITDAIDLVQPD